MGRKNTSSAVAVTLAATVAAPPPPASAPIVARKTTRRAKIAAPTPPPPPAPVTIDLAKMTEENAKKALVAAFPREVEGKTIEATEEHGKIALAYMNARDAESIAKGHKEAAGNQMRLAIGDAEAIIGDGWEATWKTQKSEIDWGAFCKENNVPSELVEKYRKPVKRVLNVKEKAQ